MTERMAAAGARLKTPELLSPAGSLSAAYAAVRGGCDAVYLSGKRFSARNLAENFTDEELVRVMDYCHERGAGVYIAVNTMFKDAELPALFEFARGMYAAGADALIMQDFGAAAFLRGRLPDIALHASTQMTAHSAADALFLARNGFDRVILSRELSFEEIKKINEEIKRIDKKNKEIAIETEVFAHGSLCVCYSGQCLMSGMIGGRSGNRGVCAQACRMKYDLARDSIRDNIKETIKSGYLLSTRDICLLDALPELAWTGVAAVKIEGRMKSPEYVYCVTRLYRRQLDKLSRGDYTPPTRDELDEAAQVFSRGGGFSRGYADNYAGTSMMSAESPKSAGLRAGAVFRYDGRDGRCEIALTAPLVPGDGIEIWTKRGPHAGCGVNKAYAPGERAAFIVRGDIARGDPVYKSFDKRLSDELRRGMGRDERRIDVTCDIRAVAGEDMTLSLKYGDICQCARGPAVQTAQNRPLSRERLLEQLLKTGGTPYNLLINEAVVGDNIFMDIASVNALRRDALAAFGRALVQSRRRGLPDVGFSADKRRPTAADRKTSALIAQVWNAGQLEAALSSVADAVYARVSDELLPDFARYARMAHERGIELFAALLPVAGPGADDKALLSVLNGLADGYLAANYGQLELLSAPEFADKTVVADHGFNAANILTYQALLRYADYVTPSCELNISELSGFADGRAELIIHGRHRLMITRQCPVGLYAADKRAGRFCALRCAEGRYSLVDQKRMDFPVLTDCGRCLAYIFNSKTLFTLNKLEELRTLGFSRARLVFTTESDGEVIAVIGAYARALKHGPCAPAEGVTEKSAGSGATNGHFFRGVT